jgi:hypothetical protein
MCAQVVQWCHWFDETVIGGEGIIILTKLNCTLTSIDITPSNTIAFAEQAVSRERSASPLIGTRGYYLHVNNDTCLYGRNWGRLENEPKGVRDLDLNQGKEDEEEGERKGEGGEGEGEEGARRRDQRWHGRLSISDEELELLVDLPMDEFLRVGSQETEAEAEEDEHGRGNLYTIAEVFSEHESMGGGQRSGAGPFIARVVQVSVFNFSSAPGERKHIALCIDILYFRAFCTEVEGDSLRQGFGQQRQVPHALPARRSYAKTARLTAAAI